MPKSIPETQELGREPPGEAVVTAARTARIKIRRAHGYAMETLSDRADDLNRGLPGRVGKRSTPDMEMRYVGDNTGPHDAVRPENGKSVMFALDTMDRGNEPRSSWQADPAI